MRFRLIRTTGFRAEHRLRDPALSDAENRAAFGATVDSHPHDYRVEVRVSGPADPPRVMVVDLGDLDRLLAEEVRQRFDGTRLHEDIEVFRTVLPTCEALAREIFDRLEPRLPAGVRLDGVRVAEDDSLAAEYRAGD